MFPPTAKRCPARSALGVPARIVVSCPQVYHRRAVHSADLLLTEPQALQLAQELFDACEEAAVADDGSDMIQPVPTQHIPPFPAAPKERVRVETEEIGSIQFLQL